MEIDPVFWKLARNWKETRRQTRKCYLSKKSFAYEIYAGISKAAHKVFQQSKGPWNAGPTIKTAVFLLKWFGIIVFVYK